MPNRHRETPNGPASYPIFVTVAELGTVSKAALLLKIAQPALSRQISSFEGELGSQIVRSIGSRLLLTSEGEQMLGECRALLTHAQAVGERAQGLGRGDTGLLKVAASPQFIEGVLSISCTCTPSATPRCR